MPARRDAAISLVVLLPGEPMHDDDTIIIIFQADRRASLGDHQSVVANGRIPTVLCLSGSIISYLMCLVSPYQRTS